MAETCSTLQTQKCQRTDGAKISLENSETEL